VLISQVIAQRTGANLGHPRSYCDFREKLRYIHRNPVKRGLCEKAEDWTWSSFRHYALGEVGAVEIESEWTARRREGKKTEVLQMGER